MAGLVNLTAKTMTLQGFQLATADDMFAALKYLVARGYTGGVYSNDQSAGQPVWKLLLSHPASDSTQLGKLTDWIVLQNDNVAKIMTAAQLTSMYNTP
jgi:hypothetical protein